MQQRKQYETRDSWEARGRYDTNPMLPFDLWSFRICVSVASFPRSGRQCAPPPPPSYSHKNTMYNNTIHSTQYTEYFMSVTHREKDNTASVASTFQTCHRIHHTEHPSFCTEKINQQDSDASWEWWRRLKDLWEEIRTNLISQQM